MSHDDREQLIFKRVVKHGSDIVLKKTNVGILYQSSEHLGEILVQRDFFSHLLQSEYRGRILSLNRVSRISAIFSDRTFYLLPQEGKKQNALLSLPVKSSTKILKLFLSP